MSFIKYHLEELIVIAALLAVLYLLFYILKSKRRRRKVGFYLSFLAYKLGFTKRMSKKQIGMVHVRESYEPLVDLVSHPKIIINNETVEHPVLLRKNVALRLYKIADKLPEHLYIKIYSTYRSRITLYNNWVEEVAKMEKENPNMGRAELLSLVQYKAPSPNINMGGHDTGAAIDLALCDKNGKELDFGTSYHEKNLGAKIVELTEEQKKNQKYIMKLMKSENFVQQPSQWWHYSYGDRYWAVYKGKRTSGAIYGSVEKEFENAGYQAVVKTQLSSVNIK